MAGTQNHGGVLELLAELLREAPYRGTALVREQLRQHHLRGLAHAAGAPGLGDDFAQIAILAAMHKQTLRELQGAFTHRSLQWTGIKGANYAWKLYREPAHRPMSDLDLLVPEQQFSAGIEALKSLGFRERKVTRVSRHAQTFVRRPHELVDLHRSILQPWRRNARSEEFWQRALPCDDFCGSVLFCDVDLTLVHIAHMARHEFVLPLVSYVDLQLLLRRLSPEETGELVYRLKAHRLDLAFQVAQHLMARLAGERADPGNSRIRFLQPSDEELIRSRHRSRRVQVARKLILFPGDAPALLAGFGIRSIGDSRLAARVRGAGPER